MLDDLLKKLKAALPEPLKSKFLKKSDDDDEDEDDDEEFDDEEEGEFDEDTEVGAKKGKKSKSSDDDDEDEDDEDEDEDEEDDDEEVDEEEAKKKKKQMLIRGLVAAVLIYVVVDELFLKNDDDLAQQILDAAPAPRPVGQRPVVPPPPAQDENQPEVTQPTLAQEAVAPPEPIEPIPEPVIEVAPSQPSVDTTVENDEPDWGAPIQEQEEFTWEEPEEVMPPPEPPSPAAQIGEAAPSAQPIQQIEEQPKEPKAQDIAGKIAGIVAEKQEYTAAPDYSILGRGLVYNCVGKHWACVDRVEYFQCRDNMVWSEQNQKAPECAIRNVYASYEDCKTIQIHYINMAEPTDFCDE